MQLRTYTGLWNVERRLYKFYDVSLPYPVSVKQLGILAGVSIPWFGLLALVNKFTGLLPFAAPWNIIWLGPPIVAVVYANRPVAEGKNLFDFVGSQVRYFLSARSYSALKANKTENVITHVRGKIWRSNDR